MKLAQLTLKKLEIPFRVAFKHASAERAATEAVIAVARSENGIAGYGEGCPRRYVTGEDISSCMAFLEKYRSDIMRLDTLEALKAFVAGHHQAIDQNPAAWCAIETALLDLWGKLETKSIEAALGLPEIHGSFHYTAVLGVSNPKVFQVQLAQYLQLGFRDFKVKISGDRDMDVSHLTAIRAGRADAAIRLDANNLWSNADEAAIYLKALAPHFWAIEEPLKARDYQGMARLAEALACKIILDESFLRIEDVAGLQDNTERWIPNIRISKMGGLLRSLAIAEACRKQGLRFIIGAQVGETSILTRTAITLAHAYRDTLLAQEGAFGTYLLERDISDTPLMFGKNGALSMPAGATALGLGISPQTI